MKRNIIVTLMIGLLLAGCSKEVVEQKQLETVRVYSQIAKESTYQPKTQFSGTVLAGREANLGTALPGRVEKVHFSEGDKVEEGDLIVELSDELLTQAEIEYKTYKKDFERMQRLFDKGSVPEMDYDHIKAQYEAKQENYEMVKKNTQIVAPFPGTVVDYLVKEGENFLFNLNLEPGYSTTSGIVRLMELDKVKVEFEAGTSDISRLTTGQMVDVKVSAYPKKSFEGRISHCSSYLNQMTRTMTVTVELANESGLLKPGMYAEIEVTLPSREGIFVPLSAVERVTGTGEDIVFIVKDGKAERRTVKRLFTRGEEVALSGVKAGEEIVTRGKSKLNAGDTVQVVKGV